MNLYLLEDHSTKIPFECVGGLNLKGCANLFLRDNELSPTWKGKLLEGRFPWKVYPKQDSPQVFCFPLHISFFVTKSKPAKLDMEVGGDIAEVLKYVFSEVVSHHDLILKLNASLQISRTSSIYIQHEIRPSPEENGVIKFLASRNIDTNAANNIYSEVTSSNAVGWDAEFSSTLTMELVKYSKNAPNSSVVPHPVQELTEKIFKNNIRSDFVLVAENGVEVLCHKAFLEAHCPAFENVFKNNTNRVQQSRHQMSLSEEGLKALLDFIYCLKLDIPKEKAGVALALLEIGIKIPMLTKAMNDLLVEQPDDWFEFDAALQLFLHSTKMQGYEELKNKAIRAMKLKRDEMESSEPCQQLLRTDPKSAMILLKALSGP